MNTGKTAYANFKQYAVRYDLVTHTFDYLYGSIGKIVSDAALFEIGDSKNDKKILLTHYQKVEHQWFQNMEDTTLCVTYSDGPEELKKLTLLFVASNNGIRCRVDARGDMDYVMSGQIMFGDDMEHDTFAMSLDRQSADLRSAYGPASSTVDNMLFDRKNDRSLEVFNYYKLLFSFDWNKKCYSFETHTDGNDYARGFSMRVKEQVYQRRFGIPYSCINKNNTFPAPPCGWMTWYAVQFGACEASVLKNAEWQQKNLKDFGANTIWVDWEWYHSQFGGIGPDNVHVFSPDLGRYPNGMKYVADEIKKLGFIPALWIGATNEPTENDFIKENPEMVLVRQPSWCGQYFFDLTNLQYIDEYIPKAFRQLKEWGFEALKWDCMPITLAYADQNHDNLRNAELTSEQALRAVVQAARNVLGEDFYMLSCAGDTVRDITAFIDIYDAARIGGDIFEWTEFVSQCIERVMKFYSYHNVVHYNDPDNIILRPQLNTYEQARSRAAFISLLGLPVTFGDNLLELPEDRIELLKRILPALDIHPMDIREMKHDFRVLKMNLAINKPFEQWNVVNVLNLLETSAEAAVDLSEDLHLKKGNYLVYDYWDDCFLGICSHSIPLDLEPYSTKTLGIRPLLDHPQILSTSRHITQGAAELNDVSWDARQKTLSINCDLVKGDAYRMSLYVPGHYRIPATRQNGEWEENSSCVWVKQFLPKETGSYRFIIQFDDVRTD